MHSSRSSLGHPDFQRAKAAFDIRYYRWAHDQAREEARRDFPSLRLIKDELVYKFLEIAHSMEKKDRFPFLSALVKRAHREGVELAGESITSRDRQFIDRYLRYDYSEAAPGVEVLDATFERRSDATTARRSGKSPLMQRINKQRLRSLVCQRLGPVLGEESASETFDNLRYITQIGPWSVLTLVDFRKKFVHLSYFHRINVQGDLNLHFALSPRQWFGLGGGSTDWKLRDDTQIDEATEGLVTLVKHFLDAVPDILAGVPTVGVNSQLAAPRPPE